MDAMRRQQDMWNNQPEPEPEVQVQTEPPVPSKNKRLQSTLYPAELQRCKELLDRMHLVLMQDTTEMTFFEVQRLVLSLQNVRRKRCFSSLMDYAEMLGKRCADEELKQAEPFLDEFWRVVEVVRRAERRRLGKPEPANDAS